MNKTLQQKLLGFFVPEIRYQGNFLAKEFNVSMVRIRKAIQILREQGFFIVANENGYMLTNNRKEIALYFQKLEISLKSKSKQLKTFRDALNKGGVPNER